jgi:hypothetical protein
MIAANHQGTFAAGDGAIGRLSQPGKQIEKGRGTSQVRVDRFSGPVPDAVPTQRVKQRAAQ